MRPFTRIIAAVMICAVVAAVGGYASKRVQHGRTTGGKAFGTNFTNCTLYAVRTGTGFSYWDCAGGQNAPAGVTVACVKSDAVAYTKNYGWKGQACRIAGTAW